MAAVHGRNTTITINAVDLTTFTDTSEFSQEVETHETTAYGDDNKTYIPGLIDGTFTFGGKYDDGAAGPKATIETIIDAGAAVTLVRRPEGAGSGFPEESFSGIVESYVETNPVGDKVSWSCDVQITGVVTRSTQV